VSYFVSRQVYWPEGQHVVEIAPGFDHASPGQLVAHYKAQGEGQEFDDPIEAAEAAILVRRAWQKDSRKRIGLTFGDADIGWDAHTQKELLAWADKMHEKVPKCDQCGEVLGSKRGDQWQHHDFPDETFCSERCVEKMLEESAKLNEEFEPNTSRKAVGILGDVNYLEYGGAVVYADGSVDLIEPNEEEDEEDEEGSVTVYRFDADRLTKAEAEREWFGDDLDKVARTVGTTKANILRRLASESAVERATAYLDVISYFGPREFDSDPLVLSAAEAEKRYEGIDRGSVTPNRPRSQKLKSSTETKAVEKLVRSAAAERFGRGQAVPIFEHDRWFVDVDGALYAVVDARSGIGTTGLDFEALG